MESITRKLDRAKQNRFNLSRAALDDIAEHLDRIEKGVSRTALKSNSIYADFAEDMEAELEDVPPNFDEAVALLRRRDPKLTRTGAMQSARRRWPSLLVKYQHEGNEKLEGQRAGKRADPDVTAFERFADTIQLREKCSRYEALRKAAREYPTADFAKYSRALQ